MLPGLEPKSFWNRSHRSPWIVIIEPLIVAFILVAVIVLAVEWQNWSETCPKDSTALARTGLPSSASTTVPQERLDALLPTRRTTDVALLNSDTEHPELAAQWANQPLLCALPPVLGGGGREERERVQERNDRDCDHGDHGDDRSEDDQPHPPAWRTRLLPLRRRLLFRRATKRGKGA